MSVDMADAGYWDYGEQCEVETELTSLRVQVRKLTRELDALRSRRCEVCGYLEHEREHTGCLRVQLAALAEQNEKLRESLAQYSNGASAALSLPNLASPVLNRIRAEGMRMAAEFCINNPLSDAHCLTEMLRAEADELESNR